MEVRADEEDRLLALPIFDFLQTVHLVVGSSWVKLLRGEITEHRNVQSEASRSHTLDAGGALCRSFFTGKN